MKNEISVIYVIRVICNTLKKASAKCLDPGERDWAVQTKLDRNFLLLVNSLHVKGTY